ncbi:alpha/beta hydrolase fold domain-containing protein [Streptomyces sp. NPDC002809]|uniref:alpha/beta hydrolase n=1 Tax=Streptomyces sp. NPDC002809 TaxID=3154433 RepID=UPI00331F6486
MPAEADDRDLQAEDAAGPAAHEHIERRAPQPRAWSAGQGLELPHGDGRIRAQRGQAPHQGRAKRRQAWRPTLAMVFKPVESARARWRAFTGAHLVSMAAHAGARFENGVLVEREEPALAEDLSGLPTTYIDAGFAEVFRDEDTDYATRIWAEGGQVELHVWAGGFHGFDVLYPQAHISITARRTRMDWLARLLELRHIAPPAPADGDRP